MIQRADTIGVFQIESRAQMSMLPRLRPKEFYDLVIEVAIVRPGPIQGDMVHPYLRRAAGDRAGRISIAVAAARHRRRTEAGAAQDAGRAAVPGTRDAHRHRRRGFTPAEADKLRRAMATFKRVGTINHVRDKFINGMIGARLSARVRRALLQPDRRLWRIRLSRKPRREFRQPRLRLGLDQMPLSGCVRRRAPQQPADGLLRAGADRARCAGPWRRGACRSTSIFPTGTARWRRTRDRSVALAPCGGGASRGRGPTR